MRKITAIQEIIQYFKAIKRFDEMPDWDKLFFTHHVKPANQLLKITGNLTEAKQMIYTLAKYFSERNLDWNLNTVIKKYPDLLAGNLKDLEGKIIIYYKKGTKEQEKQAQKNLIELANLKEKALAKWAFEHKKEALEEIDE